MHDHNDNNKGMKSMIWMMVACCAVPFLLIFIFGKGCKALGASPWIIFGSVATMIIAHFFMMRKSHKHSDERYRTIGDDKNKDDKK